MKSYRSLYNTEHRVDPKELSLERSVRLLMLEEPIACSGFRQLEKDCWLVSLE